ncbi:MAG: CDP-glycerol glycerophosphotransferase, partial [Frankiaceae bacterium]|nr:CDP-glycerol glycerophosphotransferase [Frankiaceae bacterium]
LRVVLALGGGAGRARNAGAALAQGEFLTFADGDDVVPPVAYERMLATLDETGSDFVTGNFRRLTSRGTRPAAYMSDALGTRRLRTHIRDHHGLVRDRTVWNKLFRRTFWDKHGFAFAQRRYEDQYVSLPAYFLADAVDVLSEPVYYWRIRDDGGPPSKSKSREQASVISQRVEAIVATSGFLAEHYPGERRWYEQSVLTQDLGYVPEVLAEAADTEREVVLGPLIPFLDQAGPDVLHDLPAIRKLVWALIHRRAFTELAEVLRFEREELTVRAPTRAGGSWYADYPFRDDRRLALPRELFRIDDEMLVASRISSLRVDGGRLEIRGRVGIPALGPKPGWRHRLDAQLVGEADPAARVALRVKQTRSSPPSTGFDAALTGFTASLDVAAFETSAEQSPLGSFELHLAVTSRGVRRTTSRHAVLEPHPVTALHADLEGGKQLHVELTPAGALVVRVERPSAVLVAVEVEHGEAELRGVLHGGAKAGDGALLLSGSSGQSTRVPVELGLPAAGPSEETRSFTARVPLGALQAGWDDAFASINARRQAGVTWTLALRVGKTRRPVAVAPDAVGRVWQDATHELLAGPNRRGLGSVEHRWRRPELTAADPAAGLAVALSLPPGPPWSLLLEGPDGVAVDLDATVESGVATATLPGSAGSLPAGRWRLMSRRTAEGRIVTAAVTVPAAVLSGLPVSWSAGGRCHDLGVDRHGVPLLVVD